MKKKLLLICLLLVVNSLCKTSNLIGQYSIEDIALYPGNTKYYGSFKMITEKFYSITISKDTSNFSLYQFHYDKKGKLIKKLFMNSDSAVVSRDKFSYDSQGNLIHSAGYDYLGKITYEQKIDIEYFRNNLIKKRTITNLKNEPETYSYKYNKSKKIKRVFISKDNSPIEKEEYEYDSMGRLIKNISYRENIKISVFDYQYNNDTIELSHKDFETKDNSFSKTIIIDKKGNAIKIIDKSSKNWNSPYLKVFDYDKNGNLIHSSHHVDGIIFKDNFEFTYDSKKNWIKKVWKSENDPYKVYERDIQYQ